MRVILLSLVFMLLFSCSSNGPKVDDSTIIINDIEVARLEQATFQQSKNSLVEFWTYFDRYPKTSFLKTKDAFGKEIWVQATSKPENGKVGVRLRNENDGFLIPTDQILDWMVELPNGKVLGGFSSQLKIILTQYYMDTVKKADLIIPNFESPIQIDEK